MLSADWLDLVQVITASVFTSAIHGQKTAFHNTPPSAPYYAQLNFSSMMLAEPWGGRVVGVGWGAIDGPSRSVNSTAFYPGMHFCINHGPCQKKLSLTKVESSRDF